MKKLLQKIRAKKYLWLITFFLGFILLLMSTNNAQAGVASIIESTLSSALFPLLGGIVNLISKFIGATLLPLAASLLNWIFDVGQFTKAPVVESGWSISRDIANMGFILVFLFTGFATTLRLDSYGVKQLLPKLIIIALFINFSLVIGGVFIDMGNDIGRFFISGSSSSKVGDNIMAAIAITKTHQPIPDAIDTEKSALDNAEGLLIRSLGTLALTIIVTFLFFAMVLIMFYRMIYLWLLLILAPLAWISYAIPHAGSYFSQWWTKFLQWSFFPAIFGFFIYLGVFTGLQFDATSYLGGTLPAVPGGLIENGTLPFENVAGLLQYASVIFILFFGLIAAQKWSLAGADTAMAWSKGAKNWSLGKIKGGTIRGAKFAAKSPLKAVRGLGKVSERALAGTELGKNLEDVQEKFERAPRPIGKLFGGIGATYARKQKALKDEGKRMKDFRPQDLETELGKNVITPEGLARRSAALSLLAEKGNLKDEHKKYFGGFLAAGGKASDILGQMPTWVFEKDIQDSLVQNPATKETWSEIVASDDTEFTDKALKEIIPKSAKDFSKLQKMVIDTNDKKINELPTIKRVLVKKQRQEVLNHIIGRFKEGGDFHSNHLTALANKNEGTYEILREELGKTDNLQKGIERHLISGPGYASMTSEKEETPPPAPEAGASGS